MSNEWISAHFCRMNCIKCICWMEVLWVQLPMPWISQMETSPALPAHLPRWRQRRECFWCYEGIPGPLVETIRHSFSNGRNIVCRLEGTFGPPCPSALRAGGSCPLPAPVPAFLAIAANAESRDMKQRIDYHILWKSSSHSLKNLILH